MSQELDPTVESLPETPEDDGIEDTTTEVDIQIVHTDDPNAHYPNIVTVEDN